MRLISIQETDLERWNMHLASPRRRRHGALFQSFVIDLYPQYFVHTQYADFDLHCRRPLLTTYGNSGVRRSTEQGCTYYSTQGSQPLKQPPGHPSTLQLIGYIVELSQHYMRCLLNLVVVPFLFYLSFHGFTVLGGESIELTVPK